MDKIEDNSRGYIGNTAGNTAYEKVGNGGKGAEDKAENIPKQSHTARRIYKRLVDEKGFTGAESTIRRVVREMKQPVKEAFMPNLRMPTRP